MIDSWLYLYVRFASSSPMNKILSIALHMLKGSQALETDATMNLDHCMNTQERCILEHWRHWMKRRAMRRLCWYCGEVVMEAIKGRRQC